MKSVRLTLDFGAEKQCVIDCTAEHFERLTIALEDRNGGLGDVHGVVGQNDGARNREPNRENPVSVQDAGGPLKVGNGGAFGGQYDGMRTALGLHGFPQNGTAKAVNASQYDSFEEAWLAGSWTPVTPSA